MNESHKVILQVKNHAFTVSIDLKTIYSFDRKGRLIGAYVEGINYRRGFGNQVLRKWSQYDNGVRKRQRRLLTVRERQFFFWQMTEALRDIRENPEPYDIEIPRDVQTAYQWLQRSFDFDYGALEQDAERYHQIYKPVTILPPDQYYALVLQITEGCSYNKCTFCNFYQDRPFRIKSPDELDTHIKEVREFFGESLGLRQSLFLADANALIMPQKRLLTMLDRINKSFYILPDPDQRERLLSKRRQGEAAFDGIYSFIDLFTGEYKSEAQFREMADRGVRRAYIGMESGSKKLLEFLNKPGSKPELVDAVNKVKAGGVNVGVIVLIGAGGVQYQDVHVAETIDALNQMELQRDDFIYFSDFYPQTDTPYQLVADSESVEALNYQELRTQENQIRNGIRYSGTGDSPKLTSYDIREFLY